jgi:hypothetical protein
VPLLLEVILLKYGQNQFVMTTQLTSKRQFNELWLAGVLGNRGGVWATIEDFQKSGFSGVVAISYNGKNGGGPFIKGVKATDVPTEVRKLENAGWRKDSLRVLEQFSLGEFIYRLNGETVRTADGLALYYSTDNALMRDALRSSGAQVFGLKAKMILEQYLTPADYEDLMDILDRFPDHAVEFSVLDRCVGFLPHRRTIIWEVRLY